LTTSHGHSSNRCRPGGRRAIADTLDANRRWIVRYSTVSCLFCAQVSTGTCDRRRSVGGQAPAVGDGRLHAPEAWQRIHVMLPVVLRRRGQLDMARAIVDSASARTMPAGKTGPNSPDRRKLGSKHDLIVDAQGFPSVFILTRSRRHDITRLDARVAAIPHVRGKHGRPLH
jgi:hypothetical protein